MCLAVAAMSKCRICSSDVEAFMSFGRMPIANGFLSRAEIGKEFFFELAAGVCPHCGMFQLIDQPAAENMFHAKYAFFASTSTSMQRHFEKYARWVIDGFLRGRTDPFVVELGSNDGIMLKHIKDAGIRHLGIEPSANVANVARAIGVETLTAFFDTALAEAIKAGHGLADAVIAANVMCHIPDLPSVAEGIRRLLKPDGVLIFEDPYLGDMLAKCSYDQIYDEHVFIFSASSIMTAFARHGFELIDVLPQETHGGSMRYVLAPKASRPLSPNVGALIAEERANGLDRIETYQRFEASCENSRARLMETLDRLRREGRRVVGYGATSKSTTVINYCGITTEHIEFISDTTPIKQGKLSPGGHIPVRPYDEFCRRYPDFALLFAWNHAAEIRAKEAKYSDAGGKWIVYVPNVAIVS
jgi:methylation protein EvaC